MISAPTVRYIHNGNSSVNSPVRTVWACSWSRVMPFGLHSSLGLKSTIEVSFVSSRRLGADLHCPPTARDGGRWCSWVCRR
jgi:hypothetical protein